MFIRQKKDQTCGQFKPERNKLCKVIATISSHFINTFPRKETLLMLLTLITMRNDYVNIFPSFFCFKVIHVPFYYKSVIVIIFSLSQSHFCCTRNDQIKIFLTFSEFFFCFKVMIEREEVLDLSSCQKALQTSERNERQKITNKQTNKQKNNETNK